VSDSNGGMIGGIVGFVIIGIVVIFTAIVATLVMLIFGSDQNRQNASQDTAKQEIPFQAMYQEVVSTHPNVPWTILAAVHYYSPEYEKHKTALNSGADVSLAGKDPKILALINKYARERGLDPILIAAMIQQESGWNPTANSGAVSECGRGARGLMQVMPCHFKPPLNADRDGYNPEINIQLGTKIIKSCLNQFGDTKKALMCYNGGPGYNPNNPETKQYPVKVLSHYEKFKGENKATPVDTTTEKDDKNKVTMATVKKWLEDKAKQLGEQVRLHSDSSRSTGQCVKTAKQKKEKEGMTIGTFTLPLSCAIFNTAPDKYTASDDDTWNYVQMVELKSRDYMGVDGPVAYGNLVMAGGTLPMPVPMKIDVRSTFGCRTHPKTGEVGSFHWGDDIAVPSFTPVLSVADGRVTKVKTDTMIGYQVIIEHGPTALLKNGKPTTGDLRTRYLHMMSVSVKEGQQVTKGQIIAKSGGDPNIQKIYLSTGPHLHFETYINGKVVNPYPLLTGKDDGSDLTCAKAKAAMGIN
jgi:murein DD-endopeptidase MepM/ murein hydrolase activator NlpD